MQTLTIKSLRLKNFKGVKDLTLELDNQNVNLYGKNASGKTTVQDAFFYLLFGKDSKDRADFQLKPVSADGQEIHHLDTEVDASLEVDGKPVTLMKLYKEKWTRKRGAATDQMDGHTTEHFIDGVPIAAGKYAARIGELININAFKLVTNPYEFAAMHWTDRRNLLLEICGNISDQDVINSTDELSPLAGILASCTVDDHRAKVKAQQKRINAKLKEIPARIAENQEMVKDAPAPEQKEKDLLDKKLAEYQDRLAQERNNEAISGKRVELNEINAEILAAQSDADKTTRDTKKPLLDRIDALEKEKRDKLNQAETLKDNLTRDEKRNVIMLEAIEKVRADYRQEFAKQPTNNTTCPTCGQDLPPDQIEDATKSFNKIKAKRLGEINKEGKQLKAGVEDRIEEIEKVKTQIDSLEEEIKGLEINIQSTKQGLSEIGDSKAGTEELEQRRAALQSEIESIKNGSGIRERNFVAKIQKIQVEFDDWKKQEAEHAAAEKARERIKDLEQQEKGLAAEYESLEQELFLTETFIRRKVELLEGSINSRFKLARFKLFDEQINGGLKETCEILYQGVPFERGLNTAARLNVGIDIINTLSEYFQFSGPIFCDNAESVNVLAETPAQVIGLYVSEHDTLIMEKNEIRKAS